MKIDEIEYASDIQSLAPQLNVNKSTHIGNVDNQQVFQMNLNNGVCYFLYDYDNQNYLSYIALNKQTTKGYHMLRQIQNISSIPGSVSALMYFLINNKGMKFIISANEPITDQGLSWLIKTILSDRRLFTIKDQNGKSVNPTELSSEWELSRTDPTYRGKMSVIIESTSKESYNNIFESTTGLVKLPYRIFKDKSLD